MDSREAFIALNMIEGVGSVRARSLLEFFREVLKILSASKFELSRARNFGVHTAENVFNWEEAVELAEEIK